MYMMLTSTLGDFYIFLKTANEVAAETLIIGFILICK